MNVLRQGFSWWCFADRGVEPAELLSGAAKLGYECVDLVGEELWPRVRDHGLKLGAIAGHRSLEDGLNRRENAGRIEAEKAGVTLAVELLNSKVDHKGYQCDSTACGLRLCQQVNSPAVKLLYDIYHMQIMEGDLIRTIGRHHAMLAH